MLKASPVFCFENLDAKSLKEALSLHLSDIRPAHRLEAFSRASGFNSYAGFKKATSSGYSFQIDGVKGQCWLQSKGVSAKPISFHLAASNYAVRHYMTQWPDLNDNGLMIVINGRLAHWPYGKKASSRDDTIFVEARTVSRSNLKHSSEGVLRAMACCSLIDKIKTEQRNFGSYRAKHTAENLDFILEDGIPITRSYVSNGQFIVAALASGFQMYCEKHGSLNPTFNMGLKSYRRLAALRADRQSSNRS